MFDHLQDAATTFAEGRLALYETHVRDMAYIERNYHGELLTKMKHDEAVDYNVKQVSIKNIYLAVAKKEFDAAYAAIQKAMEAPVPTEFANAMNAINALGDCAKVSDAERESLFAMYGGNYFTRKALFDKFGISSEFITVDMVKAEVDNLKTVAMRYPQAFSSGGRGAVMNKPVAYEAQLLLHGYSIQAVKEVVEAFVEQYSGTDKN